MSVMGSVGPTSQTVSRLPSNIGFDVSRSFLSGRAFDSDLRSSYLRRYIVKVEARVDFLDNCLTLEMDVNKDNTVDELLEIILKKCPHYGLTLDEVMERSKIIINNKL